jgi:hypothetical protein
MANQHTFEEKGKVQPKPEHEGEIPQKVEGPLTVSDMEGKLDANTLTKMQQTVGNAAVQRFLAQRSGEETSEVDDETAASINAKRGGGQALDEGISAKAGSAMGHDFSDVNVHTDSQSDQLSRQLGAKAFTTGSDIYFREGAYQPGSGDGQRLISHELTHVVQQSSVSEPGKGTMSVNDPNDAYEGEADSVAEAVMNTAEEDVAQRQEEDEMQMQEEDEVQMQEEEEMAMPKLQLQEEEEMQMQPIEEEEEMLQPKLQLQEEEEVQMQPIEEEEEMLQPKLQLQEEEEVQMQAEEEEEEEPVQTKLQRQDELQEEEV